MGGAALRGWFGAHVQLATRISGIACILSSFLAMVLLCALSQSLDRLRGQDKAPGRRTVVSARGMVALTAAVFFAAFLAFVSTDTIPFIGRRTLQGELSWSGSVWNVRDADYSSLKAPHEGLFALSVQGDSSPGTQLVINGEKLTKGSLLISAQPDLNATVNARLEEPKPGEGGTVSARLDFHYVLREEPIRGEPPAALSTEHWTLVTLPLNAIVKSEGLPVLWQAWLVGQQPPEQRQDITGVQVRPVMLQIAELPARRCVAILGSSALLGSPTSLGSPAFPADIRTFITPNQQDTVVVPPPDSRAELLLEDFRLALQDDGRWALVMTLIPFQEFRPPQCQETHAPLTLPSQQQPAPGLAGREPSLTVALKLY